MTDTKKIEDGGPADADRFEIGETYFTAQGEKVYLDAMTTDGKFVVSQIMRYSDYDDSFYEDVGPSKLVEKLFEKAPVEVLDARFTEAEARLADIEKRYQLRFSEVTNAEREIKDRLAKLNKYAGLEHLERFIDGDFTHFVVDEYSGYEIKDKATALSQDDRYDKKLRLLSLYGDTNGNILWELNRYRDGSGNWTHVYPCLSLEDAKAKVHELCEAKIAEWRAGKVNAYGLGLAVKSLKRAGFIVPDDLASADQANKEKEAQQKVSEAQKRLDIANAELRAITGAGE